MTLYQRLVAAGIPVDHHESDLYCRDTPDARRMVRESRCYHRGFRSALDGSDWLEVPFMYDPFWQDRQATAG